MYEMRDKTEVRDIAFRLGLTQLRHGQCRSFAANCSLHTIFACRTSLV